ncbi:MAG: Lon protease family protein [Candidatus Hodarchaeota archaeon]
MVEELPVEKLRRVFEPGEMECETTEELPPLEGIIGQERAVRALRFGLDIKELGFNIYMAGQPGTGRMTVLKDFLGEIAKEKEVPNDWCYVNNFRNSYEPKAIKLPAGKGKEFKKDMLNLIDDIQRLLPEAFRSDDYDAKREATVRAVEQERQVLITQVNRRVQEEGFVLRSSPIGLLMVPTIEGKPLSEEEFVSLSPERKDEIEKKREKLDAELRVVLGQIRELGKKIGEELKKVNHEVALYVIGPLISDLQEKYKELSDCLDYLEDVKNDILENIPQFVREPKARAPGIVSQLPWMAEAPLRKYEVNLLIDNSDLKGAPVVLETNPTHQNLFGRIEKEARFGVLTTDFTMIRSGSLHKANGGYIMLPVEELLRNIFTWDGLKMAIKNEKISVEEAGERLGFITTKGLRPTPIPLDVKVILLGKTLYYHLLYTLDRDFKELFKVKAEFDISMDRTKENVDKFASFICTFCKKENLRHHDGTAVAKLIEYSSRLADHQEKLSTKFSEIADIIREANFYATQENARYITGDQVRKAIEEKIHRSKLLQEKIQEMIERGFVLIDIEGEKVGQVNGLSVMSLGDFSFGRPSRVTSSIGMGREGIMDIERESMLGGNIHTKGVMILGGYLTEKFAKDKPLSLSARLVFEQSYGGVEGDSASSTELYAILSELSGIPIKQYIAVTGSVNQKGEVQAIGGVNQKIEGFFEVCKIKGLTGKQGVVIPESNVQNLMLREEVVDAVREGKFHIFAVKTIDEGIEVLTGVRAGERRPDGTFEQETINYAVDKRLREMAEKIKEYPEFVLRKES